MKRLLGSLLAAFALCSGTALAAEALLPRHPAPSPDGQTIAFSWQGDIWLVASEGGMARRLTVHPAEDRNPVWSRDGRYLAFSSDRHGSTDIFLMPIDGSAPIRRLTFASVPDTPQDFTPDGRGVLFISRRGEAITRMTALYSVPLSGGTAALVQTVAGISGSYSPDGKRMAFVRGGTPWTRRGYRGAANREIWLAEGGETFRQVTRFAGDDDYPTWIDDRTLVILSARSGRKNLFLQPIDGQEPRQLTFHDGSDVRAPRAAANGSIVAYEFEDGLWTVSPKGKAPRRLSILVPGDMVDNPLERRVATEGASDLALSPDGKFAAFVVEGDIFLSAVRSKDEQELTAPPTVQITRTPQRERAPAWSSDGNTLVFTSDRTGQYDIYSVKRADEKKDWTENFEFPTTRLTETPEDEALPRFAPNGKTLGFIRHGGDLVLTDPSGKGERVLFKHWSTIDFRWSPDSQFLAYAQKDPNSNSEIFIIPAAGGTPYNVSRHPGDDWTPAWSPDGRRLAWLSRRHANTIDVWGVWLTRTDHERSMEEWFKLLRDEKKDKPGRVAAAKEPSAPSTGKEKAPAKQAEADAAKPEQKPAEVKIDFDRLWERARALTDLKGDEDQLTFADNGRRILFTAEFDGERDLYSVRWDGKDQKRLTTGNRKPVGILTDAEGKGIFFLDDKGKIGRAYLDGKTGDPVPFSARLVIDKAARRAEVFEEAWRALEREFYDPHFHGVEWQAVHDKYRPWAQTASSDATFADVLNLMIDELNSSHQGYRPRSAGRVEVTGWIGAAFQPAASGPGILVREVLDDSPAARTDVALKSGERILAVAGTPVTEDLDVHALFADAVGQPLALRIRGLDGIERTSTVTPVAFSAIQELRYKQWVRQRQTLVEKLSGGRLGYIHIQSMDMESLEEFQQGLFAAANGKEGLVIDVRTNGGGWTTDYLMAALMVQRHAWTVDRGAPRDLKAYPQDRMILAAYTRPAVTICNEESYSNAEIFSHAFQVLGRGKVVGSPTFGAVISTDATTTLDGAMVRLPQRGWFRADSGVNEENNGVQPDVLVLQPPTEDMAGDRDTQLAKAVDTLLAALPQDPRRGNW